MVVREGFKEEAVSEQRLEVNGVSQGNIGKGVQSAGTGSAKALRRECACCVWRTLRKVQVAGGSESVE